jgi:hypothetical protein
MRILVRDEAPNSKNIVVNWRVRFELVAADAEALLMPSVFICNRRSRCPSEENQSLLRGEQVGMRALQDSQGRLLAPRSSQFTDGRPEADPKGSGRPSSPAGRSKPRRIDVDQEITAIDAIN